MSFTAHHELMLTWAAFAAGLGLMGLMAWRERRPRQSFNVSVWPTTPFMFAGAILAILAIVHLMSLYGIEKPPR